MDMPQFLTVPELAQALRLAPNTVYRKVKQWPHHRFGTEIRFSDEDVAEIISLHRRAPIIDQAEIVKTRARTIMDK